MNYIYKAIADWLKNDSTLTNLLEHSSDDVRISRWKSEMFPKVPQLVFNLVGITKIVRVGKVYEAQLQFHICAGDMEKLESIISRVGDMILPDSPTTSQRLRGGDVSDSTVTCHHLELGEPSEPVYDNERDVWTQILSGRITWHE